MDAHYWFTGLHCPDWYSLTYSYETRQWPVSGGSQHEIKPSKSKWISDSESTGRVLNLSFVGVSTGEICKGA